MIISKETDLWQTPKELFNILDNEFHFDYDFCQDGSNGLKPYLGDFLEVDYRNCIGFMNPPYSKPIVFIQRALELSINNNVATVALLKVDTATKWFALLWDYELHKPHKGILIRFLPKRVNFIHPHKKGSSNFFCSMVVIFQRSMFQ